MILNLDINRALSGDDEEPDAYLTGEWPHTEEADWCGKYKRDKACEEADAMRAQKQEAG